MSLLKLLHNCEDYFHLHFSYRKFLFNLVRAIMVIIYYMAHRSMVEMKHSYWFLSGPYFAARIAKMYRSRHHALFCFGLICFTNCVASSKKVSLLKKLNGKKLVRAEIETRKCVLGQQKKSTSNERQSEFACFVRI